MNLEAALKEIEILQMRSKGIEMILSFIEEDVYTHFKTTDKEKKQAFQEIEKDLKHFNLVSQQQIQKIKSAKVEINAKKPRTKKA